MKPKLIAIDACCLGRRKTGNETYVRGLLSGLEGAIQSPDYRFIVLTTESHKLARSPYFQWIDVPLGNFVTRNFKTIPQLLGQLQVDLYHASYWTRFRNSSLPPSILIIHDLSFVSFPKGFHKHEQIVYSWLVRKCAEAARHLLTVFRILQAGTDEPLEDSCEKISVTYDGIDGEFQPARSPAPVVTDRPYILYVGNLHPRKNLVRLIEAFVLLKSKKQIPHTLKIVGQRRLAGQRHLPCRARQKP